MTIHWTARRAEHDADLLGAFCEVMQGLATGTRARLHLTPDRIPAGGIRPFAPGSSKRRSGRDPTDTDAHLPRW